jgi:cyanate permease
MARAISHRLARRNDFKIMWVILLEALAALAILVLIVWWTMFCGRRRGERSRPDDER